MTSHEGIVLGTDPEIGPASFATLDALHRQHVDGTLDWLSGAGVSIAAGLPSWNEFNTRIVTRLIRRAHRLLPLDPSEAHAIAARFVERFGRDAVPDLVRQQLEGMEQGAEYTRMLRDALYADAPELEPSESHFEIAAAHAGRMTYTFNFDELIEAAGQKLGLTFTKWLSGVPSPQPPSVAHLHGLIPRDGEVRGQIVLSELDYHRTHGSWGHAKLRGLIVDGTADQQLLLIGLSIADPRLRSALLDRMQKKREERVKITALLTSYSCAHGELHERLARAFVRDVEPAYWREWDIDTVFMEQHELLPYALRCVRLGRDGSAWAKRGADALAGSLAVSHPGETDEDFWTRVATQVCHYVRRRCAVAHDEQIELGAFVPEPDGRLRWSYHWSSSWEDPSQRRDDPSPYEGEPRRLTVANLGSAQGAAGYAFLTGVPLEAVPGSRFLDRNFDPGMLYTWQQRKTFRSLLCIPVYGTQDYVPLGVVYLSSNRDVPFWKGLRGDQFDDLQAILADTWYKMTCTTAASEAT